MTEWLAPQIDPATGRLYPHVIPPVPGWGSGAASADGPRCIDHVFPGALTPRIGEVAWRSPSVPIRIVTVTLAARVPTGSSIAVRALVGGVAIAQISTATTPGWRVDGLSIPVAPSSLLTADIVSVVVAPDAGGAVETTPQSAVVQVWWEYV